MELFGRLCCAAQDTAVEAAEPEAGKLGEPGLYQDAERLFEALSLAVEGCHPVRLVRMSWLLRQRASSDAPGAPPRRQELPEEAFIPVDELRAVWEASGRGGRDRVAPVVAVACSWDTLEHPDPKGFQLRLLQDTLEQERAKYGRCNGTFEGFSEMGVCWDWFSVPQGNRTQAEEAAFRYALREIMSLLYAHQATTVLLLTQHPKVRGSVRECGFDASGWASFDRCCAELVKSVYRYDAKWSAVADLGVGAGATAAGRRWPVNPDYFDMMIEARAFSETADRDAVKEEFRKTCQAAFAEVTELDFDGMPPPTPEEMAGFFGCLKFCIRLQKLCMSGCRVGPIGADILQDMLPQMVCLQELDLSGNFIGDPGALCLASALPSAPSLMKLHLRENGVSGEAEAALRRAAEATGCIVDL